MPDTSGSRGGPRKKQPVTAGPRTAGPRSSATFRRRRLLALLIVVGVLAGLAFGVWALAGGLGGDDDGANDPTSATSPSPSASPSTETSASPEPVEPEEPETTEPAIGSTPPPPTACTADQAALTVDAPSSARVGAGVRMSIDVATTTDVPCLLNLGSGVVTVEISSGDDLVWTSAQCAFAPSDRALLLGEGATDSQAVTWAGGRSADGCPGGQPVAEAGTYRVVATHDLDGQRITGEATIVLR